MTELQQDDNARRIAQVNDLLKLPAETEWAEFKHNNIDPERMGRTISALSNSARLTDQAFAYMVWGIEDGTRKIVGTSFVPVVARHSGTLGQPLELWLRNQIKPDTNIEFFTVKYPGKRVVLLQIPAATTVPTKFGNIAYIRLGSATPKLSDYPEKEASLLSKLRPFAWERGIALGFVDGPDVLEFLDHAAYFRLSKTRAPDGNAAILEALCNSGIIERDFGYHWNITNLGALLFANQLSVFSGVGRKAVRLIQYEKSSRISTRLERDQAGGYASEVERLIERIENLLPKNEYIGKALRQESRVFPLVAIREIVANALIHQDLTITGAGPMIELFEDRMEVTNPGRPLIDTNRFIDMPPRSRNENIASLMRRMNICEERGSGIDKVISMVELYQLPAPEFRADSDNTKIILYGPRPFRDMSQQERVRACYHHAALRFLTNQKATNASLRERFGVHARNASMISRVINDTVDVELIRPSEPWNARTGHYLPFWAQVRFLIAI
jgi:ATP-dependent DNA helicase RecG